MAFLGSNNVVQITNTIKNNYSYYSISQNAETGNLAGLSASITPKTTSSQVLVMYSINYDWSRGNSGGFFKLYRGSTLLTGALGNANGNNYRCVTDLGANADRDQSFMQRHIIYLDSPSTTSSVTYNLRARNCNNDGTQRLTLGATQGGNGNNSGQIDDGKAICTVTLWEIA